MTTTRDATSTEQLDRLLEGGRINRAEYDRLRGGMEGSKGGGSTAPANATDSAAGAPRPPLRRPRRRRVLAGVCAGLAEHFQVPVWIVRLVAFLLIFVHVLPAVAAYVIGMALIPEEAGPGGHSETHPPGFPPSPDETTFFAIWTGMLMVAVALLAAFFVPFWMGPMAGLESRLPMLSRVVIAVVSVLRHYNFLAIPSAALLAVGLVEFYRRTPLGGQRVAIWVAVTATLGLSAVMMVIACFAAFIRMRGGFK